jgi:hypothetical protein
VEGSYRFLRRVWNFGVKLSAMDMVELQRKRGKRWAA